LRREEVAALADVSMDYIVRLEQGRDTRPSPSVLAALAGALRMSDSEWEHLLQLSACTTTAPLRPSGPPLSVAVPTSVITLLDALERIPAFVVGPYGDLLAWNPPFELLVTPLGLLDGPRPNLARFVFLDPRARAVYPEWAEAADEQGAWLRGVSPRWQANPAYRALLNELTAGSAEFEQRWAAYAVTQKRRGTKRLVHPAVGQIKIGYEVLVLADEEQRLITWQPADEASAGAIARAVQPARTGAEPRLRVV
jgi:transcriptional regulator with XRE-family HTH domain